MPAIIPFIPLIAAGVTGGTELGLTLSGAGQPSAPKQQAIQPPQQDITGQKEALLSAAPSVQERLGGSVAPDFFASEVARVSGNPQDTSLAEQVLGLNPGLGGPSTNQTGLTAQTGIASQPSGVGTGSNLFSSGASSPFGGGQPNFFDSLFGGEHSGSNEFSGGYQ